MKKQVQQGGRIAAADTSNSQVTSVDETSARRDATQGAKDDTSNPAKRRRVDSKQTVNRRPKQSRPLRPRKALTFELSKHHLPPSASALTPTVASKNKGSRSGTSTPTISQGSPPEPPLTRLSRISVLMTAIHRRNKNQHRNQLFYKQFSILRRGIDKLIDLYEQCSSISKPVGNSQVDITAASTRQRLEKEAQLRDQREILEAHVREKIVPNAYVAFSAVVADTQFANLGLVLLGLLADVVGVVGAMRTVEKERTREKKHLPNTNNVLGRLQWKGGAASPATRLVGLSTLMTGPDHGTVIERVYDSDTGIVSGTGKSKIKNKTILQTYNDEQASDMGEVIRREDFGRDAASILALREESMDLGLADTVTTGKTTPGGGSDMKETLPFGSEDEVAAADVSHVNKQAKSKLVTETSFSSPDPTTGRRTKKSEVEEKAKAKKSKRKKNAIDDLFSGFG